MDGLIGENNQSQDWIKDATTESFMADVVEASQNVPVLVDFWATWCGPCKTLGPTLEKLVMAAKGKVRLVKVDVDQNQMIASQMGVQSIPAVFAFWNGRPVDYFTGALPESQLQQFISKVLSQTNAGADGLDQDLDHLVQAAEQSLAQGAHEQAAQIYSQLLQADSQNVTALAGLAKCHIAGGNLEQAEQVLNLVPPNKKEDSEVRSAQAQLALAKDAGDGADLNALNAALDADENNHQVRFDRAKAYIGAGQSEAAIDDLLYIISKDADWEDGAARTELLKIFDALGFDNPLAIQGRRRLSSLIFA
ncbi:MAG: thioredoxin [Sphingomonadales bacterium]|jgi:putative thioredoxin